MRISIKSLAVLALGLRCLRLPAHNNPQAGQHGGVEASQTQSMINLKDVLDASTANIPTLTAVGYAVTRHSRAAVSRKNA